MNNTVSSRFTFFEMMRIFCPGAYAMFIGYLYCYIFEVPLPFFGFPELFFLIFLVGSFLTGLTLYAKETPKRRKAFQTNQPSTFILDRSRIVSPAKPLTESESKKIYFYILNHEMPATVHDKIFFFGMIYTVMINIRRISFWFGLLGLAVMILNYVVRLSFSLEAFLTVAAIWMVYFFNVKYNKADRKMQENFLDQIFWLEMNIEKVDILINQRISSNKPGTV